MGKHPKAAISPLTTIIDISTGSDTFTAPVNNIGDQAIFLVTDNTSNLSGLYLFTATGGNNASIEAAELTLLSIIISDSGVGL